MSAITVEDRYKKKDPRVHIYELPDTYIGSVEDDKLPMWIMGEEGTVVFKEISYIPGLFKIFDEIIVNSRDQTIRNSSCTIIKVEITGTEISVYNNGCDIAIEIHKAYNIYVPELIFSHLLTSENYDVKGKTVGGKNGYGAKLTNIFSLEFVIEIYDKPSNKLYTQTFKNNMSVVGKPIIKKANKPESYIKTTFKPDFARFSITSLSPDMIGLFEKRVYDIAACTADHVKVYLNNRLIKLNSFKDYITKVFYNDPVKLVYEEHPRWKVGAIYDKDAGYRHISYVNGICTFKGGSHVSHVVDQILRGLVGVIVKKYKLNIKPSQIKDNLTVFVDAVIEDPNFDSQTKEFLTSKIASFGSRCEISDNFIKTLAKTGIIEEIVELAKAKASLEMKKTDGKKISRLGFIPKLEDATDAGTRNASACTLILTEGDSAKTFAISGLSIIGQKTFGVFPLRGKLLNVRDKTPDKINKNKEICDIKKIMGLKQGKDYKNTSELRYGKILILTDQDLDGAHIKGLLINFISFFWPSLTKIDGFIQTLATPIIKVWRKNDIRKTNVKEFYTLTEYEKWKNQNINQIHLYNSKYFKGLGTSEPIEAKQCFQNYETKVISYILGDNEEESTKSIILAFDKKCADDRKNWLKTYNKDEILENSNKIVPYTDFINKELKHFSNHDNIRSIPCIIDGLKPGQRKCLYGAIKKNIYNTEIKVNQLAGYIGDHTNYHHGEASLFGTIIKMAQNYPGSNNINLLLPLGNFGYRKDGGASPASPRYINTQLNSLTAKIFRAEDNNILEYIDDDGTIVEPITYVPIIPMVLINGAEGIGTGFSTKIPAYNPLDVIKNIRALIATPSASLPPMTPWYRGFKGTITKTDNNKIYNCKGVYEILNANTILITEIPIEESTDNYNEFLHTMEVKDEPGPKNKQIISNINCAAFLNKIQITITFVDGVLQKLIQNNEIEKVLKLNSNINLSNIHTNTLSQQVQKHDHINEILTLYYEYRLEIYDKRKKYMLKQLKNELNILKYKILFLDYVLSGKIIIFEKNKARPKALIINRIEELNFPKLSPNHESNDKSYDYITKLGIFSITEEELNELKRKFEIKTCEYNKYKSTPIQDIWISELDELEKEYRIWLETIPDVDDGSTKPGKGGKKKNIRKKKIIIKD